MMIPGVSICSLGEARGHDLTVDETLLTQLAHEITRKGKVIVKLNHKGGLDTVCGWLQNARIKAGRLLGDLELFRSGRDYSFVRELVEKFGSSIGLSPAFTGSAEPLADGRRAARCRELHSVDLVESPASNPTGLFSAEFNGALIAFEARPAPVTLSAKESAELRHLWRRVAALQIRFDGLNRRSSRLPNDDEDAREHNGGTSVGHDIAAGSLEGAGAAVLTDALLHGEGTIAERLAGVGRSLRTPIISGLPKKALIGAASGGLLTAGAGLAISKIVERKRKEQENRFARLTPDEERQRSLYRVAGYRHKIGQDELDRAAASYTKAAALGGIAGGLVGSFRVGKTRIGAGIGALAGIGSVKAIREALPADQYGQHSPEEHQIEKAVPLTAAAIGAIAARKKLKQTLGKAAQKAGKLFP